MANLLSLLGMGAVAGADASTAALEGQQIKRDREQKDLLARLQQDRQAEQDAQAREMQALQRRNLLSMIQDRERVPGPESSPLPTPVYDRERGGWVTYGQPFKAVEGLPEIAKTTREPNIDPLSAEGIRRSIEKEREMASVKAEMGDRSIARPTESQEKSYMFGGFMKNAMPTIDALSESRNVDSRKISAALSEGMQFGEKITGPGTLQNLVLNDEEQQLLNAARMFTAGLLRKESGAAVTPSELRDTFARFIPLGGDSPALRAQKLANRKEADRMMEDLSMPARSYYDRERQGAGTTPRPSPQDQPPAGPADVTPFMPRRNP